MKISMSLRDLQASPTARNRRERRKLRAIEGAETQGTKTDQRRAEFLALVMRALGQLERGDEPDDELRVVLPRAWEPKSDAPFHDATMLLYRLAVGCVLTHEAESPTRHRLGRMFDLLARVYCGENHNVTSLREHLVLAFQFPEWRPPWIDGKAMRPAGGLKIPDTVPSWLTVLGAARGAFLQGVLPRPDMRINLARMTTGHPWAMFVSCDEIGKLRAAASSEKRKSNAMDPRPKVPRGMSLTEMAGLPSKREASLAYARQLDGLVPGLGLAADMSASMKQLSGETNAVTADVAMLIAVSPAISTRKQGAGSQVVRGLLDRGIEDPRILSTLANLSDSRVHQLKTERQPK
jgi:hypothetical protein